MREKLLIENPHIGDKREASNSSLDVLFSFPELKRAKTLRLQPQDKMELVMS